MTQAATARANAGKGPSSKQHQQIYYATRFAVHFSEFVAKALESDFPGMKYGEVPSRTVAGMKDLDVMFSTPEAGLGFAISLKSVHVGEKDSGASHFAHNMKRNDEELRVEATAHHLRQPYAVMVAVLFLPFESCVDRKKGVSSFGAWVQYLWPLKGREESEDPPDRFELVFVALYARAGSELGFYQVGGLVKCPKKGRPASLLTFEEFLRLIRTTYYKRNGKDFAFEGDTPPA